MKWFTLLLAVTTATIAQPARSTPFSADSALALLHTLSVDIGPRPMGSPAEQRALKWAVDRLRAAGLDDAQVMEIRTTPPGRMGRVRNTRSGVAVGTLRGATDRIILIGGHIDSASPEIPGTNDDGSGTAVVLELARILAQRAWQHTIVFCLFGGEEAGLVGSRSFVDHYASIDKVDLMLQVDMANGGSDLVPFIDKGTTQTPSWLVHTAQQELLSMGYEGLAYPFHFFTWNIASGSGASSDHEPFLVRGIPAIDFTTDPSDPIHTPQDSWEWFRQGGLERSGDLVYRLVERFDGGMPDERTGSYVTMPVGSAFLMVPTWVMWALIAASILAGAAVTILHWSRRAERRGTVRPRIPGLKVSGAMALIWTAVWAVENVAALLSGWRSPWFSEPWLALLPAIAVALAAAVLVARWSRTWNLSNDPLRYILRSTVWFSLLMAGAAVLSPRLAAYLAWGLLFNVVAWTVRPGWVRILAVMVGAYPIVRLLTPDLFPFIARTFAQIPAHSLLAEAALTGGLALVCTIVSLPYAFGALAVVRDPAIQWPWSFSYRHPAVLGFAILLCVASVGVVSLSEPYSAARPRAATITSTIVEGQDSASTTVQSPEWLRDLRLIAGSGDTLLPGSVGTYQLPAAPATPEHWLRVDAGEWTSVDTGAAASGLLALAYDRQPVEVVVRAEPIHAVIREATAGSFAVNQRDRLAEAIFDPPAPDGQLLPLTLRLSAPDTVVVTVEATYAVAAVPVAVEGAPVNVERRTVVRFTRRITIPPSSAQP